MFVSEFPSILQETTFSATNMKPTKKLSSTLPPLVFGTATFNYQFNPDPFALGPNTIVQRALSLGVRAFDTSPYYGPAEEILGAALSTDLVRSQHRRESYCILTKVGRLAGDSFDYSPLWIRHSVKRSCKRLRTSYLDLVYCHDVEFVSPQEVLTAIRELRRIRDEETRIRYVGISGYPVDVLCSLAEMVLRETGEPLDAVMSYASFTLQNTRLLSEGLPRLVSAGVDVVPNASPLGMGLLRREGPPVGSMGDWHPAPSELKLAAAAASQWTDKQGEKLEVVAVRWALENWIREGAKVGTFSSPLTSFTDFHPSRDLAGEKLGVTVMGVSNLEELHETMRVWNSVLDGIADDLDIEPGAMTPNDAVADHEWSLQRRQRIRTLAQGIRKVLGAWKDFAWQSPGEGFVNQRKTPGLIEEEDLIGGADDIPIPSPMLTPPSEAADDNPMDNMPGVTC